MNYYWDENLMKNDGKLPSILAIGDSWFWYPLPGGSLINYIGPVVEKKSHVILAKGMNGAEAFDYVDGKYARSVREALRLYGAGLSAAFISGGGNDFAGFNDLRPL
ncbi:MAG TPA: SGNH/GDSL hydrolase family protein, partial [Rhodoferax sp.]|nr:SGNH/GDSL hydrolase family protein [Rhodoferax sp.]